MNDDKFIIVKKTKQAIKYIEKISITFLIITK